MSLEPDSTDRDDSSIGWITTVVVCFLVLLAGGGVIAWIYSTEPTARRAEGTKTTAMLVDVITVDRGTYRPRIDVMGTVQPAQDIVLRPRVNGKVIERSEEFTPGGFVDEGEVLVRLDPSDYRNTIQQRKSELRQARSDLKIEMGRQEVAREEYELLNETLSGENRDLVLREPQLEAARAQVESARASLEQAQLDLDRTRVRAPFDALVLDRNVNVGSQVSTGDNLAHLVGMDTYWVETTVPLSKLRWLSLPDTPGAAGSRVRIRNRSAWSDDEYRVGDLYKLVGELEQQARMARILVRVGDPLARESSTNSPPLIIGSFVQTSIQGTTIPDVIRLKREYVREDDTVWVMQNGKLNIRDVEIVFRDEDHAYIRSGLKANEHVVTTNISTVVEGAELRVDGDGTSTRNESSPGSASGSSPGDTSSEGRVQ